MKRCPECHVGVLLTASLSLKEGLWKAAQFLSFFGSGLYLFGLLLIMLSVSTSGGVVLVRDQLMPFETGLVLFFVLFQVWNMLRLARRRRNALSGS